MSQRASAVSIVLSTYNRSALLGPALERLLDQSPDSPPHELIVVDNNSTDDSRSVVEAYMGRAKGTLRYVFEPREGLSHGRNAGIAASTASIVAFTDDDVRVAPDWVGVIARTFEAHPDVDCVGGRTLPVWPSPPPPWLTKRHWVGPLALQDYGDRPFILDARRPLCLAGANFAFRKRAFDRVGLFSAAFPRSEDTELMLRLWLSGARAMYVPGMLAFAAVQAERLEKGYHRRWHTNIGRCNARMKFEELSAPEIGLRLTLPDFARVMGVPLFAVRQLIVEVSKCLAQTARRRPAEAFLHETRARALLGYVRESRRLHRRTRPLEAVVEPAEHQAPEGPVSIPVER